MIKSDITILSVGDPFYSIWLMNVDYSYDEKVERTKIKMEREKISLLVNKKWYEGITDTNCRLNVLRNSILHIVLLHWYYENEYKEDLLKYLIACELESTCYLTGKMDDNDITVDKMNMLLNLKMEKHKDFKYYYSQLPDFEKCKQPQSPNEGEGFSEGGMDETDKEMTYHQFKGVMEEAKGKAAGQHLDKYIDSFLDKFKIKPSEIPWQRLLRNKVNQYGKQILPSVSNKRLNKYYPKSPGQKHEYIGSVLVVIDTSGSISRPEYEKFISEIFAISKKYQVFLMHCDTAIRYGPVKFSVKDKETFSIHGGGGTLFSPAIKHFNESKHTICVYFTDTYGESSITEPTKPVLWITRENTRAPQIEILKNSQLIYMKD